MKLRATLTCALLLGALPVSSGALTSVACASEGARAVLVVDTGSGAHRYCVALPKNRVTGIELIKLASAQHGLQYKLGFGGNAVCQLAGVGPDGNDCFADDPYFWGYWRGDGSGGWNWSSSGAGSTVVQDGSVEGWSWGTGRDGRSHPRPPSTNFTTVCPTAPVAKAGGSKPAAGSSGSGGGDPAPAAERGSPAEDPDGAPDKKKRKKKRDRRDPASFDRFKAKRVQETIPAARAVPEAMAPLGAPEAPDAPGPPRAGMAGLAVAGLLTLLGAARARRRVSKG